MRVRASTGWSRWQSRARQWTRSKAAFSSGSARMSCRRTSTLDGSRSPAPRKRGSRSVATTRPVGPTRSARKRATEPAQFGIPLPGSGLEAEDAPVGGGESVLVVDDHAPPAGGPPGGGGVVPVEEVGVGGEVLEVGLDVVEAEPVVGDDVVPVL